MDTKKVTLHVQNYYKHSISNILLMKCDKCSGNAIMQNCSVQLKNPLEIKPSNLCKSHFIEYFEGKVAGTISEYGLIEKTDKIAVAASGGKDSTALLYLLNKFHGNVDAIAIDEGIKGYRDKSLEYLKKF